MTALLLRPMEAPPVAAVPAVAPPPVEAPAPAPERPADADPAIGQGRSALALRVRDRTGAAVACSATLWRVLAEGGRAMGEGSSQACVAGALRWEGLPAGTWRLLVQGPALARLDRTLELGDDEVLDLGEQVLPPGGRVLGTLTQGGQPAAAAVVRSGDGQVITADAQGRYRLEGVPEGPLRVDVMFGDHAGQGQVQVQAGEAATLDLALEPVDRRGVVGLRVDEAEGRVLVRQVVPGSPADGVVQPGDLLLAIDGQALGGDMDQARALLAGRPGEPVVLTVQRGEAQQALTLTRAPAGEL